MTDRIDMPQPGFYKIKRGDRFVPAKIEYIQPIDPDTGETIDRSGDWTATIDGEPADVSDVWEEGKRRASVSRDEYEKMLNRPPPPALLAVCDIGGIDYVVDTWRPHAIADSGEAARCRDFLDYVTKLHKRAEENREKEKRPHLDAGRAVDAEYRPLLGKLEDAREMLKGKITEWLRAQDEERRAQAALAHATAEMQDGTTQEMNQVPATVQVIGNVGGRAASLRTYRRASYAGEWDAVAHVIRTTPAVIEAMEKAASALVRAGVRDLPGFTVSEEQRASL